jgi:polyisoprenyl-phosphate glycosyltransferase
MRSPPPSKDTNMVEVIPNSPETQPSDSLRGGCHNMPPSSGIPTTDPAAALEFCRSLQRLLTTTFPPPESHGSSSVFLNTSTGGAAGGGDPQPVVSVVIPVYNEADNIPILASRLTSILDTTALEYEIVFVDDGSCDTSAALLEALAAKDTRIVVVGLARNFGHQVAISAGLDHAQGRGVIVMDADLQDPPEVLPQFIAKWREGYDVVYAVREQRKEHWFKRNAYATFYRLLRCVASIEIPLDAGDFCIMDHRVVGLLRSMPERNRFIRGLRSWVGLRQTGLRYERQARHTGRPKYTFGRLILLAFDGLISFSHMPLRAIALLGLSVSLFSIVTAMFYTLKKLTAGINPPGFATLIVAIFFLAGVQLITIGVIGEYVGRIFEEVKQRPLYIVRQVAGARFARKLYEFPPF